jgi:hypothetical protein
MSLRQVGLMSGTALVLSLATGCTRATYNTANARSDIITEDDIARVKVRTAYDAVVRLHGTFLSHRGETSVLRTSNPDPNVYLDDVFVGTIAQLKSIPASDVATIRLYRTWEAQTRFGPGNMGGVIEVYTKH